MLELTCLGRRGGLWAEIRKEISTSSQQPVLALIHLQGTRGPIAFPLRKSSRAGETLLSPPGAGTEELGKKRYIGALGDLAGHKHLNSNGDLNANSGCFFSWAT